MVALFDDSVRFVAAGEVTVTSPSGNQARLQAYLDRSTFQVWDDIAPPIRISPDGRMAYKIVQKRVKPTAPDSTGRAVAEDVVAIASTDHPGP